MRQSGPSTSFKVSSSARASGAEITSTAHDHKERVGGEKTLLHSGSHKACLPSPGQTLYPPRSMLDEPEASLGRFSRLILHHLCKNSPTRKTMAASPGTTASHTRAERSRRRSSATRETTPPARPQSSIVMP